MGQKACRDPGDPLRQVTFITDLDKGDFSKIYVLGKHPLARSFFCCLGMMGNWEPVFRARSPAWGTSTVHLCPQLGTSPSLLWEERFGEHLPSAWGHLEVLDCVVT